MKKVVNMQLFKKCFLTSIVMMFTGMVMQVGKAQLFLKKEPPAFGFIISVIIAYIVMGFLYAFVFYITRHVLPGKTPAQKGLYHSLFASLIILIPGALGMIAFDIDGGFHLLTSAKIEAYAICVVDVVNLSIGGLVLAKLFKDDIKIRRPVVYPKTGLLISSFVSAVLFPLMMLTMHFLVEKIMPLGIDIPDTTRTWYYIGLILPFILSCVFLPVYYQNVKDAFPGSPLTKLLRFFMIIYFCYWLINVLFLLPFGYSLQTVIFYLVMSILPIFVIILVSGYITSWMNKMHKG